MTGYRPAQPRRERPGRGPSLWVRRRAYIEQTLFKGIAEKLSQERLEAWDVAHETIEARRVAAAAGKPPPRFLSKNNANAKRMKLALKAIHQAIGNQYSWSATIGEIAAYMCASEDTAERGVRDLEEAGFIRVRRIQHPRTSTKGGGGKGPSQFTIMWGQLVELPAEAGGRLPYPEEQPIHEEIAVVPHDVIEALGAERNRPDERSGGPGTTALLYVASSQPHKCRTIPHNDFSIPHGAGSKTHGAGSKTHGAGSKTHGAGSNFDCAGSNTGTPRAPARARESLFESLNTNPSTLQSLAEPVTPSATAGGTVGGGIRRWTDQEDWNVRQRLTDIGVGHVRMIARDAMENGWTPRDVDLLIEWWEQQPRIGDILAYPVSWLCRTIQENLPCRAIPFGVCAEYLRAKRDLERDAAKLRERAAAEERAVADDETKQSLEELEARYGAHVDELLGEALEAVLVAAVSQPRGRAMCREDDARWRQKHPKWREGAPVSWKRFGAFYRPLILRHFAAADAERCAMVGVKHESP